MADRASGAAWRRRQRRLRSWWRHEQQTVAAVLASVAHHPHSKVGTANAAQRGQKIGTSTEVGPAEYFELSSHDGRPTGRERPAALLEPLPQGKVKRHAGIGYEIVQNLDVPVPQMVEQLPNIVQFFATHLHVVVEPVIEVPKILPRCSSATFVSRHAAGGTVGGSADDRILFFFAADHGAERGHSSSWSWRAKCWSSRFSSQNRVRQRCTFGPKQIIGFQAASGEQIADIPRFWWRVSRFTPRTEFILFFARSSSCS